MLNWKLSQWMEQLFPLKTSRQLIALAFGLFTGRMVWHGSRSTDTIIVIAVTCCDQYLFLSSEISIKRHCFFARLSSLRQMQAIDVFATKIENYLREFENKLVSFVCPGPPTAAKNTRKSNARGRVLYSRCPLILKPSANTCWFSWRIR